MNLEQGSSAPPPYTVRKIVDFCVMNFKIPYILVSSLEKLVVISYFMISTMGDIAF